MKRTFLVTLFLSICLAGLSNTSKPLIIQVYRTAEFVDSTLSDDQAVYIFNMETLLPEDSNAVIHYSIDSVNYEGQLEGRTLRIKTTPGLHNFQFYINKNYHEVFASQLNSAPRHVDTYAVHLYHRRPQEEIITFKPVIYLYPEEATEVVISLKIDGENPFYYPMYEDGWKVTAEPNGQLTFNGESYRYLFWEATQDDHLNSIELSEGFVVEGGNATHFLESTLKKVGFTSEERADFITFWGPKIAANDLNIVRFEWNETCDKFAELAISPKPDHLYRFYIFTAPIDTPIDLQPQALPIFERDGFTVLEWGGQQSTFNQHPTP